MTTLAQTIAPPRERVAYRVAFQVALVVLGSFMMAGLAQVKIYLPFTPVPITGQTFGVLLLGAAYGPGLGAATMLLYLLWGAIGLPVFAPNPDGTHEAGLQVLSTGATGGYLWSYPLSAFVVGWLSQRGWDRAMRSSISAMFIGELIIYAVGIPWLMIAADYPSLEATLQDGLYPFVIGDTLKLFIAAGLLPVAWKFTKPNKE
ncbi:MAG: biotin transporter BioY [Actinomycetota bacterium]